MAYRSGSSASSSGLTVSPAVPAGAIASDVLIMEISGTISSSALPLTPPAGWTLIGSDVVSGNWSSHYYWAMGDVASTTFTASGATFNCTARISAFSGRNTSTPISTSAVVDFAGNFANLTSSALTVATGDDVYIAWDTLQTVGTFGGTPAGLTDISQIDGSNFSSLLSYQDAATAGVLPVYSRSESHNFTGRSVATIALAAAASGPTVTSASSNSNAEGSAIVHTITLSAATTASTNFAATLVGVSATGGGTDFTSALASLTYSAGVTASGSNLVVPSGVSSFTVSIPTTGDVLNEANETYTLTVGGVSGTGTITDNDAVPVLTINDATQSGNNVTFTVTLTPASGRVVTVNYATANGTKTAGVDYTATSGTLSFAAGETTKQIVVPIL